MKNIRIIITEDGSHTIFDDILKENYHSVYGAVEESKYIFIQKGLMTYKPISNNLNILEVGFGTGLNALLTFIANENLCKKINYIAIEPFILPEKIFCKLNYIDILKRNELNDTFLKMHYSPMNIPYYIDESFILYRLAEKLQDIELSNDSFDVVYFDAFSPKIQPELWTVDVFNKIYNSMKIGGQLITYSSSGEVKRNLKAAGFELYLLQGPKGKRHITMAKKNILPECCSHNH